MLLFAKVMCRSLPYLLSYLTGCSARCGNSIDSASLFWKLLASLMRSSLFLLSPSSLAGDQRIRLITMSQELKCSTAVSLRLVHCADLLSMRMFVAKSKSNFYFFTFGGDALLKGLSDKYLGLLQSKRNYLYAFSLAVIRQSLRQKGFEWIGWSLWRSRILAIIYLRSMDTPVPDISFFVCSLDSWASSF